MSFGRLPTRTARIEKAAKQQKKERTGEREPPPAGREGTRPLAHLRYSSAKFMVALELELELDLSRVERLERQAKESRARIPPPGHSENQSNSRATSLRPSDDDRQTMSGRDDQGNVSQTHSQKWKHAPATSASSSIEHEFEHKLLFSYFHSRKLARARPSADR